MTTKDVSIKYTSNTFYSATHRNLPQTTHFHVSVYDFTVCIQEYQKPAEYCTHRSTKHKTRASETLQIVNNIIPHMQ